MARCCSVLLIFGSDVRGQELYRGLSQLKLLGPRVWGLPFHLIESARDVMEMAFGSGQIWWARLGISLIDIGIMRRTSVAFRLHGSVIIHPFPNPE